MQERKYEDGSVKREVFQGKRDEVDKQLQTRYQELLQEKGVKEIRTIKDIGRNSPCPCGSGHKFKKCCLKEANDRRLGI